MGGRGSSSGGGGTFSPQILTQPPNILSTPNAVQQANQRTFDATDSRPYHDLKNGRNYYLSQNLTIDQQIALVNYLSPNTESGSLYSMSQNMNHQLATGGQLNANQQYVYSNMMGAMHNLGENINLTRYDHAPFIDRMLKAQGINTSYDNLTAQQLKNALVGQRYGENKLISTSYNDFVNAPPSSKNVFTSRAVKITYKANANVQGIMTGNGAGGALGEIVLAPSGNKQNFRITDVRYTGQRARSKGTQTYNLPQVEIVVEATTQL